MPLDDQAQTRLALASFFAALARTLGAQDKSFPPRFDAEMERQYRLLEDHDPLPMRAMETLRWCHDMIDDRSSS